MIADDFFRSMSLAEDLDRPGRFSHYKPTRRAAAVLEAILSPSAATMVIAPYGSGKSLAAGVAALAVRNGAADGETLAPMLPAFDAVAPRLGAALAARLASDRRGLVVVLSGHEPDPLAVIARAAGMAKAPQTPEGFGKAFREGGWDHVAVVWDEFGRHLEGLIGDGRPDGLDILQRLAERSVRSDAPTMSLTLLLHQNLLAYASRLNETTRSEWRKIEGRFDAVRMVEDSQEIYQLAAEVVAGLRPGKPADDTPPDVVAAVLEARWLDGMADVMSVARTLDDARPLTPGALQILPALVARVGQNERSLFAFLREADLGDTVGVEEVYATFADALRSDVGIGGAYRRWLETESARSRARNGLQREILAAACLLQLGVSGERRRLPRFVLELAVLRPGIGAAEAKAAVDELLAANLLLWRRHNDDVAVWHGADIDVSLRVKEERERLAVGFDLKTFLDERFPAPNVRAPGHNARFGVNRHFVGGYVGPDQVAQLEDADLPRIDYVLARNRAEIDAAGAAARRSEAAGRIVVVPDRPVEVESAAIEVLALEALRADRDFVGSDPMVTTELDELESVAFQQLASLLRLLLDTRGGAATWWSAGRRLEVTGDHPAPVSASTLLDDWFRLTPLIANDQLMRDQPSRTTQTARVRVVGAILERHARERLGYDADERSAEASIYRTVLERTGLHRAEGPSWRFVDPDELPDGGLREAWSEIALFFRTATGSRGRPLAQLVDKLARRPHGVPRAVLPLLIAAGYKRFARIAGIYRDGIYLPDLLGFQFDQLASSPDDVVVRVEQADIRLIHYLRELCYAFTHEHPGADDELVRQAVDAITRWRSGVPEGSKRTQKLDPAARSLLRAIDDARDPLDLVLTGIPAAFGSAERDGPLVAKVERVRKRIDGLADEFAAEAVATIEEAFRGGDRQGDVVAAVRRWAGCFDAHQMDGRSDLRISDKALLRKAVETANGRFSPKSLAGALSSILLQRALDKWDDRTAAQFRAALREARERIETAALDTASPGAELRPIVLARLDDLTRLLAKMDDVPEQADAALKSRGGGR